MKQQSRWPKGKKDSPKSLAIEEILAASFAALTREVYKAPTDPWTELTGLGAHCASPETVRAHDTKNRGRKPLYKPVLPFNKDLQETLVATCHLAEENTKEKVSKIQKRGLYMN